HPRARQLTILAAVIAWAVVPFLARSRSLARGQVCRAALHDLRTETARGDRTTGGRAAAHHALSNRAHPRARDTTGSRARSLLRRRQDAGGMSRASDQRDRRRRELLGMPMDYACGLGGVRLQPSR